MCHGDRGSVGSADKDQRENSDECSNIQRVGHMATYDTGQGDGGGKTINNKRACIQTLESVGAA